MKAVSTSPTTHTSPAQAKLSVSKAKQNLSAPDTELREASALLGGGASAASQRLQEVMGRTQLADEEPGKLLSLPHY